MVPGSPQWVCNSERLRHHVSEARHLRLFLAQDIYTLKADVVAVPALLGSAARGRKRGGGGGAIRVAERARTPPASDPASWSLAVRGGPHARAKRRWHAIRSQEASRIDAVLEHADA